MKRWFIGALVVCFLAILWCGIAVHWSTALGDVVITPVVIEPPLPEIKAIETDNPDFLGGPLTVDQRARWDCYIRALETNLPPLQGKVFVRFEYLKDELAYTVHDGTDFTIVMDWRLCFYAKRDTLIHEWAHTLDWWTGGTENDHGPSWALQYGRCYNEVMRVRYRE